MRRRSARRKRIGGNDYLCGGTGNDSLSGLDSQFHDIETIPTGFAYDQLYAEADNDSLAGGAGEDTLQGLPVLAVFAEADAPVTLGFSEGTRVMRLLGEAWKPQCS